LRCADPVRKGGWLALSRRVHVTNRSLAARTDWMHLEVLTKLVACRTFEKGRAGFDRHS